MNPNQPSHPIMTQVPSSRGQHVRMTSLFRGLQQKPFLKGGEDCPHPHRFQGNPFLIAPSFLILCRCLQVTHSTPTCACHRAMHVLKRAIPLPAGAVGKCLCLVLLETCSHTGLVLGDAGGNDLSLNFLSSSLLLFHFPRMGSYYCLAFVSNVGN